MKAVRRLAIRLGGWFGRPRRECDLTEEFQSLLQMHVDEHLRSGVSLDEARRLAMLEFGGVEPAKEAVRDMWTFRWIDSTIQDLRYAIRGMMTSPGFSTAVVLSLALGIGGSLAIFTIVDNLLLRPLPYPNPDRLVMLWEKNNRTGGNPYNVISPANFFDWKAQSGLFESMGAFATVRSVLTDGNRVEELGKQLMSADILPMLGAKPVRGRLFSADEDRPGRDDALLISYRLWQTWFGGEESVIGRKVQINSTPREIIGVMPPGFYFRNREVDLWEPLGLNPARDYRKGAGRFLTSLGRMKPGVSEGQAQTEMNGIAKRVEAANPVFNKNWGVTVEPLRESLVRDVKPSLLVLLGAVGLLLAIACANIANLLLARYASRRREMAVRCSLGAGRWRVIRQLLTESLVLGITGGLLGLLLARWEVTGLLFLAPKDMLRSTQVSFDLRIVLAALALSLATGIIFGLAPALIASRTGLAATMREDSRTTVAGGGRLRAWLVGAEVALSVILLAGAGLLFRSFVRLQGVDPGLDPSRVLTFQISIPAAKYRDEHRRTQFFQNVIDELKRLPGVRSASAVSYLPFNGLAAGTDVRIGGRPDPKPGEEIGATIRTVMPGYFRAIGIPLRRGRDFTEADNQPKMPHRFIVNEAFVRKHMRNEEALGQQLSVSMARENPFGEIVGIVGDVKEGALDRQPSPTIYYTYERLAYTAMVMIVRVDGDPLAYVEQCRKIVQTIDPGQPISLVRSMEEVLGETMSRNRFSAILMVVFSTLALALAAIGIYGVLAYSVSERTREIGVRAALGADPGTIAMMVMRSGGRLVIAGLLAGLAGALALSGVLTKMLYQVGARDPLTFVATPVVLGCVGMLAAYLPARRAARLDPMVALRTD